MKKEEIHYIDDIEYKTKLYNRGFEDGYFVGGIVGILSGYAFLVIAWFIYKFVYLEWLWY